MPMMEESAGLKVTRDLKAAVSAILQGYGDGQQSVTDASAELHRLCGCLELLLQFDQKEKKSFLRPRKDYWDFLSTALWQQRGDMEPSRFVRSQEKLKTPLGKGRAFIRFCLAHGQLAESLQLCLLNPELTRSRCSNSRKTQGRRPRRDKVSPKKISAACGGPKGVHQEEPHPNQASCLGDVPRGDCFAGLSGSQPHKHLPPFLEKKREDPRSPKAPRSRWEPEEELQQDQSEGAPRPGICLQNSTPSIQGQREGSKGAPKEVIGTEAEGRGGLPGAETQRSVEETHEGEAEWGHVQRLLTSSPRRTIEEVTWGRRQESEVPSIPGEHWVLQGLEKGEDSTTEKPQKRTGATSVAGREAQAEASLQDVVKSLRHQLRKAKEQGQHQKQLLMEQDRELKALQKQLSRCQEESAQLQAELARKQQEAERRDAMYQEELGGQRDLVQAMKRRVLELIQEKDNLWQKVQHLSSVAPECCVSCSKIFGRLSRRYPCRLQQERALLPTLLPERRLPGHLTKTCPGLDFPCHPHRICALPSAVPNPLIYPVLPSRSW
ncbi:RUN and FYVE domain-containing protein 4 isoform X3 [Trichechus manatus latirostris]|uniref:RUN and FYVE domain-containing protein 4 n=1 Tax=Trichechus manatus latirostris TaxID=127582 RepID=A0A2Y9R0P3_TRIMA|nr:RUN and FYVE domain-containing protein 4 isoform X3 [Trichechus manatus latirostris]